MLPLIKRSGACISICVEKGERNMSNQILKGIFLLGILLAMAAPSPAQYRQNRGQGRGINNSNARFQCQAAISSIPGQTLDSTEAAGIAYMREEEKLAHDVYATLHAKWGVRIFRNISQSEERHFDTLKLLLDRYELPDPAANKPIGLFQNEGLQELFNSLIAEGESSLTAALKVGAGIEELDIRDLEKAAAATDNNDLKIVYQNLRLASENHLRAFISQLNAAGVDYVPQHITQARFSEIITNVQVMGRGNGARGGGRGFGRGNNGICPWMNP
jgi:hypothetical protein